MPLVTDANLAEMPALEVAADAAVKATKRDEFGRLIPPVEAKPKDIKSTDETIRAAGGTPPPPPEPEHIVSTIGPGELKPTDAVQVPKILSELGLTPAAAEHVLANNPLPRVEVEQAQRDFARFKADPKLVAAWNNGDAELQEWVRKNTVIRSSPIFEGDYAAWVAAGHGPKPKAPAS